MIRVNEILTWLHPGFNHQNPLCLVTSTTHHPITNKALPYHVFPNEYLVSLQ